MGLVKCVVWGGKIEMAESSFCEKPPSPSSFPLSLCSSCCCLVVLLLSLHASEFCPLLLHCAYCPSPTQNAPLCVSILTIIIIIIIIPNQHKDRRLRSKAMPPASHARPRQQPLLLLRPSLLLPLLVVLLATPSSSSSSSLLSTTSLLPPPPSSYSFSPASLPPPSACPSTLKTGTTIAGVVCGDAVVLAADTRYVSVG